jgi:hypothetical protein
LSQKSDPFLDDFVNKVHSGEYIIHEDAQKLKLPGGTLAYLLGQNMTEYEEAKRKKNANTKARGGDETLYGDSVPAMALYQLVNLAFTHNLVRSGEALSKKIRLLETQVSTLTSEKWELNQEIKRMFAECPKCHFKLDISSLSSDSTNKGGRRRKSL